MTNVVEAQIVQYHDVPVIASQFSVNMTCNIVIYLHVTQLTQRDFDQRRYKR
jgi:hypothetical protein